MEEHGPTSPSDVGGDHNDCNPPKHSDASTDGYPSGIDHSKLEESDQLTKELVSCIRKMTCEVGPPIIVRDMGMETIHDDDGILFSKLFFAPNSEHQNHVVKYEHLPGDSMSGNFRGTPSTAAQVLAQLHTNCPHGIFQGDISVTHPDSFEKAKTSGLYNVARYVESGGMTYELQYIDSIGCYMAIDGTGASVGPSPTGGYPTLQKELDDLRSLVKKQKEELDELRQQLAAKST